MKSGALGRQQALMWERHIMGGVSIAFVEVIPPQCDIFGNFKT